MEIFISSRQEDTTHAHVNTPPGPNSNASDYLRRQRALTKNAVMRQGTTSPGGPRRQVQSSPTLTEKKELLLMGQSRLGFRPIRPNHDDDEFDRPSPPSFLSRQSRCGTSPSHDDQTEELRGLDFVGDLDDEDINHENSSMGSSSVG